MRKNKHQLGYYNIDFGAMFVAAAVVGAAISWLVFWASVWVWRYLKPLLHALTA